MYVAQLSLSDFRSYTQVDLPLRPGVTVFVGPNGHGKTNLVEAVGYLASQSSHRVGQDAPLVRTGASSAIVRGDLVDAGRHAVVEIEINPGKSNRARLNGSAVPRPRDVLGILRTVWFSPEDLALVKGEPETRRRFLDDLLVARAPRFAGVRHDYDRVLRQRNTLLRSLRGHRGSAPSEAMSTLDVWDAHLAGAGAELVVARLRAVDALRPLVATAYAAIAADRGAARIDYRASFEVPNRGTTPGPGPLEVGTSDEGAVTAALAAELRRRRGDELDRGVSLAGPHRDDLVLALGEMPAKGYASHGEAWSFALALRLASYELLCNDGAEPVLILDDVFAELDTGRRDRLAKLAGQADQLLVTAAVPADVPGTLVGETYEVAEQEVCRADPGPD